MRTTRALLLVTGVCGCSYVTHPYYRTGFQPVLPWAEEMVDHRLILIGDAGDPLPGGEPSLQMLAAQVRRIPEHTTVVFLGDNVYERGMPEEKLPELVDVAADAADVVLPDLFDSRVEAERHLNAQIDAVRGSGARAIFIPGNHDWDQFEIGGWERILALQKFIKGVAASGVNVTLQPQGGCPGPVAIPLGAKAELIAIDTQWWLETRIDGKPTADRNPTGCKYVTEGAVRDAMVEQMRAAAQQGRKVVIAGHHPLESNGPHGGFFDLDSHLFPLRMIAAFVPFYIEWLPIPIVGTIAVELRACCSVSAQDMGNRRNEHMRAAVTAPMLEAERHGFGPLLYAAGHDHSAQIFEGERGPKYTLVSGLGSSLKASAVGRSRRTLFAHANPLHPDFMIVDFNRDGSARLGVVEKTADAPEGEEVYSMLLTAPPHGANQRTVAGAQ